MSIRPKSRPLTFPIILCSILVALGIGSASSAQSNDTDNAAVWYQRAIELQQQRLTPKDLDLIYSIDWDRPPTHDELAALAKARPILELMRKGSQRQYSDFNLNYEDGFELMLPHLGSMRSIAKIAHAEIVADVAQGRNDLAVDRMQSLIRMTSHLNDDRILISSLVGRAVYGLADRDIQAGLDRGIITGNESAGLARSLASLDPFDPFGTIEAIATEQFIFSDWMERNFVDPDKRIELAGLLEDDPQSNAMLGPLRQMSKEQFLAQIDSYNQTMDRYVEAFRQEDPEIAQQMMDQIQADLETGKIGILATQLVPAFSRVFKTMREGRDTVETRKTLLNKIAKDAVNPEELINAATIYQQAISRLDSLDESWKLALDEFESNPRPLDLQTINTLDESVTSAQPVLDLIYDASKKRRCDFSFLRKEDELFLPPYLVGMKRLLQLTELDMRRRIALSDKNDQPIADPKNERRSALAEAATIFRIISHLSKDDAPLAPIVAHESFNTTMSFLSENGFLPVDNASTTTATDLPNYPPPLTEKQYRLLNGSINWIPKADPFGYIRSTTKSRESAAKLIYTYTYSFDPKTQHELRSKKDVIAQIAKCPDEALPGLFAILDQFVTNFGAQAEVKDARSADRVAFFKQEQLPDLLESAKGMAPDFLHAISDPNQNEHTLNFEALPRFPLYETLRKSARNELRRAVQRIRQLRPEETPQESSKDN